MATVFVAEQDAEPREIALKILRAELHADKTFARRFEREAKAAARVQHPNSVTILDAGVEGDVSYIAMELLHGDDLFTLLDRHGAVSPRAAATIVAEICDALVVAHGLGIVHRDLKPENIMIVRDPAGAGADGSASVPLPRGARVKVLDFGIAKLLDKQTGGPAPRPGGSRLESETGYTAMTRVGTLIGTPAYMSPEQCALQPVDTRSDIYTCGLLLFQMVSGRLPFDGPTPLHIATKHLHEEAPPLSSFVPGADARLEAIIQKTLAKRPADRHSTARALAAALRKLIPELPDEAYPGLGRDVDPDATPILTEDSITSVNEDVLSSMKPEPPSERMASMKTMVADGLAAPPPSVVVRGEELRPKPLAVLARHPGPAAGRPAVVPAPEAPVRSDAAAPHTGRNDTDPAPATPTVQITPDVEVEAEPEDLASTLIRATPGEMPSDGRDSFTPFMAGNRQPTMQSAAALPSPDRPSRTSMVDLAPAPAAAAARPPAGVQTLVSGQAAAAASVMISPAQPSVILSPSVASPAIVPLAPPPAAPLGSPPTGPAGGPVPQPRLHGSHGPTFGIPGPSASLAAPNAAPPPDAVPGTLAGPMVSRALLLGVLIGVLGSAILFALAYAVFLTK